MELDNLPRRLWRQQLAWLGQEPQLFYGTVRDNLMLGQLASEQILSDEALKSLLAKAHVLDFIESQPQGLDFAIKEQTAGLSVGQAQRIALARALGQQPKLFILDEPTASLDSASEQAVQSSLEAAMTSCGCLLVTHRLNTLNTMDKLLVMERGLIVQQGSYDALASVEGAFKQMLVEPLAAGVEHPFGVWPKEDH